MPIDIFETKFRWGRIPIVDQIDATGDCWEWTGSINSSGYGTVGHARHVHSVHRVVWEYLVGPIPDGLEIDHLCRNRRCCNPDHMEVVTRAENQRRGIGNQNVRKTRCVQGHPLFGVNLYVAPDGKRACRTCRRRWWADFRVRNKEKQHE